MIAPPRDIVVTRWQARFMGRTFPCATGRGGIRRVKREGDGATPAGSHALTGMLYRPDRIDGSSLQGALPIRAAFVWSDDPEDPDYNGLVRRGRSHRRSHERMMRPDPLYDLVILTGYNRPPAIPGAGSAIFIHAWRRPRHPTEGCVAFAAGDLAWIASRLTARSRLVARPE